MKNELNVGSTYGIYVVNSDGGVPPGGMPGLITNNFIHIGGTNVIYQNAYYNSANITSSNTTQGRAMNVAGGGSNNINIVDIIFADGIY